MWRDLGYAVGAVLPGVVADLFGVRPAVWLVAVLTFASGVTVAFRLRETNARRVASIAAPEPVTAS